MSNYDKLCDEYNRLKMEMVKHSLGMTTEMFGTVTRMDLRKVSMKMIEQSAIIDRMLDILNTVPSDVLKDNIKEVR